LTGKRWLDADKPRICDVTFALFPGIDGHLGKQFLRDGKVVSLVIIAVDGVARPRR
jgi:hypothetical protein